MPWTFRLRIRLHESCQLRLGGVEQVLAAGPGLDSVVVSAWPKGGPIEKSTWLLFKGTASSEDEGWKRGDVLTDRLRRAFARLRVAAELGKPSTGGLTDYGHDAFAQTVGATVLDDMHGLMVYPTDLQPKFFSIGRANLIVGQAEWRFTQTLAAAGQDPTNRRERIAFDLYSASLFENSAGARLMTLVMALETLLSPPDRSPQAIAHVDRLITETRGNTALSDSEQDSLVGSLRWLRRESITKSGILFMRERLADRRYGAGLSAEHVWKDAYDLRSSLAHGRNVSSVSVERVAGQLFEAVGDLLSGKLLAFEPQLHTPPT